jgi:hypothetical protein
LGIVKADIGIRDGRISGIGKAGNPQLIPNEFISTFSPEARAVMIVFIKRIRPYVPPGIASHKTNGRLG